MLMKMKRPTESISDAHRRIGAATSTFSLDNIHSTLAKHCYKKKKKIYPPDVQYSKPDI